MIRGCVLIYYIKHYVVAIVLSLSFGLVFSCARSYKASDESSDEPQSDVTPLRKDASIETDLESHQVVASGERVGELEYIDSGIDISDSVRVQHTGFVAVDKWDESIAHDGIDAPNAEQIPTGLWVGETKEEIACTTSRQVVIEIATAQESNRTFGVVVFGEGDPPSPAQIPDIGFSSEVDNILEVCHNRLPTEGFVYTILEGYINENGRFHFRIGVVELYQSWCALRISYQKEGMPIRYGCRPDLSPDERRACYDKDPGCPVDYHTWRLCADDGPCICTQDGCVANMNKTLRFDLTVDGSEIEGVVINLTSDSPATEVRLRKVR